MNLKYLLFVMSAGIAIPATAHTDLMFENFDGDYTTNFPIMIEGDDNFTATPIRSLFMDDRGITRPWHMLKDTSTSTDGFIASHSYYSPAGKSNDWLCSRELEITSDGFELSFDAQSVAFRNPGRKSSLWVFITEEPVSKGNLPTEATWVIEDLTFGEDPDVATGDFAHFKYSLDNWAHKKIYINFVNQTEDADLLVIDNVLVRRLDPAEMNVTESPLLLNGSHTLPVSIKGTMGEGLKNWVMTATFSNGQEFTESGESLALDEIHNLEIPFSIGSDEHLGYKLTLTSDNADPITFESEMKGLAFMPVHRVLMEEATGLWCGNCPLGQFTIESMMLDPEMKDKVIPVSVHVPSSVHANYLVVNDYATPLGMTVAPAFRLDREFVAMTFSQTEDTKYDPSNEASVAGTVRKRAAQVTTMDITVDGEFIVNGNDTTGIRATAKVIPALSSKEDEIYAIGFVLTENNVWLPNHMSWSQENYISGFTEYGDVGGWASLPKIVPNVRLQDVARGVYGYIGLDNSLPIEMKAEEEYSFTQTINIPDTHKEEKDKNGKVTVNAPAIVAANCGIVAYVIDRRTNTVVNAAYHPMTEQAEERFTTADLVATLAVDEVSVDKNAPVEYFTIEGIRVKNPGSGRLYIRRQGSVTSKIIF